MDEAVDESSGLKEKYCTATDKTNKAGGEFPGGVELNVGITVLARI